MEDYLYLQDGNLKIVERIFKIRKVHQVITDSD